MKFTLVGILAACVGVVAFFALTDVSAPPAVGSPPLPVSAPPYFGPETDPIASSKRIQVALLLDTSNSMDGLIDQARSQLWKMVNELAAATKGDAEASLEIALYQYGNDDLSMRNGYVQQLLPLTTDLDAVSAALFALTTSGGSEYAPWTIVEAATDMEWTTEAGALRIAVIAGNENFAQGSVTVRQACEAAAAKGISVNPVFCGDYQHGIRLGWNQMQCTEGTYLNIDHNDQVAHVATPYDDDVMTLNRRLNATYIGYGSERRARVQNQAAQDANALSVAPANARTRAFAKSKKVYKNASWDLVDYAESNAVGKLDETALPDTLRAMSERERVVFVREKAAERAAIQTQLRALEQRVDAYLTEQRTHTDPAGPTLDHVLIGAIRAQAVRNGFTFESKQ